LDCTNMGAASPLAFTGVLTSQPVQLFVGPPGAQPQQVPQETPEEPQQPADPLGQQKKQHDSTKHR
jgi:hypothetical protein